MKKKRTENIWENFIKNFQIVNSLYRTGDFEKVIFYHPQKNQLREISFDGAQQVSLQSAAGKLFIQAKESWERNSIPLENFSKILRSITISFEIDEYFLCLTPQKQEFYLGFVDNFWNTNANHMNEHFNLQMYEMAKRVEHFPDHINADEYTDLAVELILINLCGVNVLYMQHSFDSYKKGLCFVNNILEFTEIIIQRKNSHPNLEAQPPVALGLKGLAYFFEGRFNYGLGEFQLSEDAFKKSISFYIEKMNRLVSQVGLEDAQSRTLSLRRANFAEIIGLVNLYLIESRIDEALVILQRVRPLFEFNAGKLTLAYCDLLAGSVNRAKYSSDEMKLKKIEISVQECLQVFNESVPESHFPQRANIELSLIYFYRAKNLSSGDIEERKALYEKCFEYLDQAILYSIQPSEHKEVKNRRILVEALTIRSHIYRNYADLEKDFFIERMEKSMTDAKEAVRFAKNLKQLESDAVIAVGIAYRDLYEKALSNDVTVKIKEANSAHQETAALKEKSRAYFFKAIDLNTNDNPRISAICYLRLAELEMLNQSNSLRARFFFDKYKKVADKISHQYLLEFAHELERELEERAGSEFFIDPNENLELKFWRDKLEAFLIEQTIFHTAREIEGILPSRRQRNHKPDSTNHEVVKTGGLRETRKSVLAKAFIKKMGIAPNKAYEWANDHLKEFERLCEEMLRQK